MFTLDQQGKFCLAMTGFEPVTCGYMIGHKWEAVENRMQRCCWGNIIPGCQQYCTESILYCILFSTTYDNSYFFAMWSNALPTEQGSQDDFKYYMHIKQDLSLPKTVQAEI